MAGMTQKVFGAALVAIGGEALFSLSVNAVDVVHVEIEKNLRGGSGRALSGPGEDGDLSKSDLYIKHTGFYGWPSSEAEWKADVDDAPYVGLKDDPETVEQCQKLCTSFNTAPDPKGPCYGVSIGPDDKGDYRCVVRHKKAVPMFKSDEKWDFYQLILQKDIGTEFGEWTTCQPQCTAAAARCVWDDRCPRPNDPLNHTGCLANSNCRHCSGFEDGKCPDDWKKNTGMLAAEVVAISQNPGDSRAAGDGSDCSKVACSKHWWEMLHGSKDGCDYLRKTEFGVSVSWKEVQCSTGELPSVCKRDYYGPASTSGVSYGCVPDAPAVESVQEPLNVRDA